jgi:hypothetical protein
MPKNSAAQRPNNGAVRRKTIKNVEQNNTITTMHTDTGATTIGDGSEGPSLPMQIGNTEVNIHDYAVTAQTTGNNAKFQKFQKSKSSSPCSSQMTGKAVTVNDSPSSMTDDDCEHVSTVTYLTSSLTLDDIKDDHTDMKSSVSSRPRRNSAHAVLSSSSHNDDHATTVPSSSSSLQTVKNTKPPRGRKVFDYRLAQKIPGLTDMNAQCINVEFSLHYTKVSLVSLYPQDENLGRELIRVRLGLSNLRTELDSKNQNMAAVVTSIKSTQSIRIFTRRELTETKGQIKNNDSMISNTDRQLQVKMSLTFQNTESANTAKDALSTYIHGIDGHIFSVKPGTVPIVCGTVTGVPRPWNNDDFRAFVEHNLRNNPNASIIGKEIVLQRKSNRVDTSTTTCDFAMSSRAFKTLTTMSTIEHRTNRPIKLQWATKYRGATIICTKCLDIGHTSRNCESLQRCHQCGDTTHTRKDCTAAKEIPCLICTTHTQLSAQTGSNGHTTDKCPHLRTKLVEHKTRNIRKLAAQTPPVVNDTNYPALPRHEGNRNGLHSTAPWAVIATNNTNLSNNTNDNSVLQSVQAQISAQQDATNLVLGNLRMLTNQLQELTTAFTQTLTETKSRQDTLEKRLAAQDDKISDMTETILTISGQLQTFTTAAMKAQMEQLYNRLTTNGVIVPANDSSQQRMQQRQQNAGAPLESSAIPPHSTTAKQQQPNRNSRTAQPQQTPSLPHKTNTTTKGTSEASKVSDCTYSDSEDDVVSSSSEEEYLPSQSERQAWIPATSKRKKKKKHSTATNRN